MAAVHSQAGRQGSRPFSRRASAVLFVALAATSCGRSDPALLSAVSAQLAADPALAPLRLDVSVSRGIVKLAGDTNSGAEQRRAIELSRAVKGVKDVISEMRISDTAIVANVKKALTADALLQQVPIDVDARDGQVRLMSDDTDAGERQRALALAKTIEGVSAVEDRMK